MKLIDPLQDFDWESLYDRYDAKCRGYDKNTHHLNMFKPNTPRSDRYLYYALRDVISNQFSSFKVVDIYSAILYWKLYSQHTVRPKIDTWRQGAGKSLNRLIDELPDDIGRSAACVLDFVRHMGKYQIPGMKSDTALPVRTTFLHFLFPNVVPVFDRMVLQAVGVNDGSATGKMHILGHYLPFVWEISRKYQRHTAAFTKETSLRVIDMALWAKRGL